MASDASARAAAVVMAYGTAMQRLVEQAERDGVILTVERVSKAPLAMGNTFARVAAYPSKPLREELQAEAAKDDAPRIVLQ